MKILIKTIFIKILAFQNNADARNEDATTSHAGPDAARGIFRLRLKRKVLPQSVMKHTSFKIT